MKPKGTQRERLERSKQTLRSVFADVPAQIHSRPDAAEILARAWLEAGKISDWGQKYFRHYMLDEKTGEFISPAKFHAEVFELLLTVQYAAVAAPREHAKSTVVSLIFVCYCLANKLRRFVVLLSDTQPQARLLLGAVKAELEDNEKLREDYGDLVPQGDGAKWAEEDIVTTTGIRVSARGANQSLRGLRQRAARPDLVILDDVENDESVENPETRKKLRQWFLKAVMNLGKHCQVLVIGTILHHDALLANLLREDQFENFTKRRYEAVDESWSQESVLWPARWSVEALQKKCRDVGIAVFAQEFRNRATSKEDQTFREEWFTDHYYTPDEIRGKRLRKVSGFDPAIKQKQKADRFAEGTIGVDDDGTIFVLRAQGSRIPFNKQVDRVFEVYAADQPMQVGIETIAYQEALKMEVERRSKEEHVFMPIVELKPHSDKTMRIASLAPLVENGTIRFRKEQADAINEFLEFPRGAHDDIPDILEQLVGMVRKTVSAASLGSDEQEEAPRRRSIFEPPVEREEAEGFYAEVLERARPGFFGTRIPLR